MLQFTSSSNATFAATCGTISSAGLYTAPLIPDNLHYYRDRDEWQRISKYQRKRYVPNHHHALVGDDAPGSDAAIHSKCPSHLDSDLRLH